MTGWGRESLLRQRIEHRFALIRAWARRATASGLALRGVVWVSGTAAVLLALPGGGWRLAPLWVIALLLGGASATAPGSGWVSVVVIGPVVLLLAAALVRDHTPPLAQVMALAAVLYLHHSVAALAAWLRTDTVVPAAVFARWGRRAGAVVAASLLVSLAVVGLSGRAPAWPATGYVLVGAAAAVGAVAVLAYLRHRVSR